jgi:predicted Zn-ribbon and HTH transcriptional regulator
MAQETPSITTSTIASEVIEGTSVVFCVPADNLVVSEDKLRYVLLKFRDQLGSRDKWIAPAGIGISLLLAFATSNFKDFMTFSADSWRAFFLLAIIVDAIWLVSTITNRSRPNSTEEIVNSLKEGGRTKSMTPVAHSEELPLSQTQQSGAAAPRIINTHPQCMNCGFQLPAIPMGGKIVCPICKMLN